VTTTDATSSAGTIPGTSVYGTLPPDSTSGTSDATKKGGSDILANGLGADTFLKLLVAQLQYQNPLSPTDGTQFMSQLAQFAQVEKLNDISSSQTDATSWQRAVLGEGLIGKTVSGTDTTGSAVTDLVSGLQITDAGPLLMLKGGGTMDVSNISNITPTSTTGS
jgi:flagellar basal-body rod modification protein FlgD